MNPKSISLTINAAIYLFIWHQLREINQKWMHTTMKVFFFCYWWVKLDWHDKWRKVKKMKQGHEFTSHLKNRWPRLCFYHDADQEVVFLSSSSLNASHHDKNWAFQSDWYPADKLYTANFVSLKTSSRYISLLSKSLLIFFKPIKKSLMPPCSFTSQDRVINKSDFLFYRKQVSKLFWHLIKSIIMRANAKFFKETFHIICVQQTSTDHSRLPSAFLHHRKVNRK